MQMITRTNSYNSKKGSVSIGLVSLAAASLFCSCSPSTSNKVDPKDSPMTALTNALKNSSLSLTNLPRMHQARVTTLATQIDTLFQTNKAALLLPNGALPAESPLRLALGLSKENNLQVYTDSYTDKHNVYGVSFIRIADERGTCVGLVKLIGGQITGGPQPMVQAAYDTISLVVHEKIRTTILSLLPERAVCQDIFGKKATASNEKRTEMLDSLKTTLGIPPDIKLRAISSIPGGQSGQGYLSIFASKPGNAQSKIVKATYPPDTSPLTRFGLPPTTFSFGELVCLPDLNEFSIYRVDTNGIIYYPGFVAP